LSVQELLLAFSWLLWLKRTKKQREKNKNNNNNKKITFKKGSISTDRSLSKAIGSLAVTPAPPATTLT